MPLRCVLASQRHCRNGEGGEFFWLFLASAGVWRGWGRAGVGPQERSQGKQRVFQEVDGQGMGGGAMTPGYFESQPTSLGGVLAAPPCLDLHGLQMQCRPKYTHWFLFSVVAALNVALNTAQAEPARMLQQKIAL